MPMKATEPLDLPEQGRARIAAAIRAAEARTSGEIVCVLARRSVDATGLPILLASALALALPWALVAATTLSVTRILLVQAALFLAALAVLSIPVVRRALVPAPLRRALAEQAALEQFDMRGIAHTKDRTGILVFVSLAEHYARIVADDGIAARVPQSEWQGAVDALTDHIRQGQIAEGFIAAIGRCGNVLADHFPPAAENRDELRDRIYFM